MALKIKRSVRSVPFLARMWQANIARMSGVEQEPLTPEQFGQLKRLRNIHRDITLDVMLWALENWTQFSQEAKKCAGLPCAPDIPDIRFLFAHCQVAVYRMCEIALSTKTVGAAQFIKNVNHLIHENWKRTLKKPVKAIPNFSDD